MTVPVSERIAGPYSCNGALVTFSFAFKVFTSADIRVVRGSSITELELTLDSDYTVELNADQQNDPGGTVTTSEAHADGYTITIDGALTYGQPTELQNLGGFFPKVHERAWDRMVILIQQLKVLVGHCLRLPVSSDASTELPLPEAGKFLGWNSAGDALENLAGTGVGDIANMDFTQAGDNAIESDAQTKLRERLTVTDYESLVDGVERARTTGQQLIFTAGVYELDASITKTFAADQHWVAEGRVEILWTGAADAQMFVLAAAGYDFRVEGPFLFNADDTARECMRVTDTVGGSNITFSGPRFENAYNAASANGAAGLLFLGGFSQVNLDDVVVRDVSRAAGVGVPSVSGSLGIGVIESGGLYCPHVELNRCQIIGVTSEEVDLDPNNVDCDGFFHSTPSGASFGNEQPSSTTIIRGGRFEDNRGRHVKTQSGWTNAGGTNYIRDTYKSTAEGTDIDIQFGHGVVHDNEFFYNNIGGGTPFGASFATVTASVTTATTVAGALTVTNNTVHNNYPLGSGDLPYFLSIAVGAAATFRSLTVHNNKIMGSGRLGSLINAAGSGGFAGGQINVNDNECVRLSSHLADFAMSIATARFNASNNHSTEGTLRALVHSDVAGGVPIVHGGGNQGFIKSNVGALGAATEAGEVFRADAYGDPENRSGAWVCLGTLQLDDDASGAFRLRGQTLGRGIYMIHTNHSRLSCGMFAHDGVALDWLAGASTDIAYGDVANPDTDTKLCVWMDNTTKQINVKQRLGAADVDVSLWSFG